MSLPNRHAKIIGEAQRALLEAIRKNGVASADDIRSVVAIPDDVNPSIVGIAVRLLSKDKIIKVDSIATTERRIAHARLTRVWRLADRPAAAQWLAANQADAVRKSGGNP